VKDVSQTTDEAQQIADAIRAALPHVKSGTLRFWGQWFGRPHDNFHRLVGCEVEQNILKVYFNEAEVLSVWSPASAIVSPLRFRITRADRVRWEWFYYGRPKIAANLYFEEYINSPETITATTNVDWYTPEFKTNRRKPAVEIL
jgi:hypothetical protein